MGYYCVRNQLAVEPEIPGGIDVTWRSDTFFGEPPPITNTNLECQHNRKGQEIVRDIITSGYLQFNSQLISYTIVAH